MRVIPVCRPLFAVGFVLALISALAPAGQPDAPKTKPVPNSPEKARNTLDQTVTLTDQLKNAATLKDFLDVLEAELKLKFDIDDKAFAAEGATNILATDYAHGRPMRVKEVKVKELLRNLLARVPVTPYAATYVVVGDTIILSTELSALYRLLQQRVNLDCDKEELSGALKRLADKTGASLVLDSRATDEARTPVTLQLNDVTLETAAILLAETVRLKAVRVGNAVFLTTKEHANEMLGMKFDPDTKTPVPPDPSVSSVIGPLPLPKEYDPAALP
jgi:hypothetical protein